MTTTCSSEEVLLARTAAVRAASWASSEPSVARRIFVGKMLNLCNTPLMFCRLGDCPTNHLRQYALWTFGVQLGPPPAYSWFTFPGQVMIRSAPPQSTLSRPRDARGGYHLCGQDYAEY